LTVFYVPYSLDIGLAICPLQSGFPTEASTPSTQATGNILGAATFAGAPD